MNKQLFFKMRENEVAHLLQEVEQGNVSALKTYGNLKKCHALFAEAIKQIEPTAREEADNYSERTFKDSGFVFEKRTGGIRFDYKHIQAWQEAVKVKKEIEEKCKLAYQALQRNLLVGTEDAEVVDIPNVTYSKDSLIVR